MNPDGYESTYAYRAHVEAYLDKWLMYFACSPEFRAWCRMIALKRGSRR